MKNSLKRIAHKAGLLYLLMAVTGPIGLIVVPTKIIVEGNLAATAQNVVAHEMLIRTGIISNLVCQISFIFLLIALLQLFKGVNENYSKLMFSLVIASIPIAILNELNYVAVLLLSKNPEFLPFFLPEQLNALITFFMQLHEKGTFFAGFFWGLWLLPFGVLVIKSGYMPKLLGIFLIVGCFSYLFDSSLALLYPKFRELATNYLLIPLSVGEISMVFWLVFKGAKVPEPLKNNLRKV